MNRPDLARPTRRPHRLPGRDYASTGTYFLTLVTYGRACIFGEVNEGQMVLSQFGEIVQAEWFRTGALRTGVRLDAFVVMPNHMHALVTFTAIASVQAPIPNDAEPEIARPPRSLGALVAGFKSTVTKQINIQRDTPGHPVWQRNYHDLVVRGQTDLSRIRAYIHNNPRNWHEDPENPMAPK